ncbi:MAG: hypothetical protein O2780_03230 [Proteobacteria bacterium]|jgi:hypothetical protein|nr:hypothetical protein [Pseudomonadota bacterium]MDA1299577.1 hypothetical protein [Pseudomonadota bacterium]
MGTIARTTIIFTVLIMTMIINQEDNLLARLGMTANYLVLAGIALILALLLANRQMLIIGAAVLLSFAANVPVEYTSGLGLDRDFYGGFLFVLVLQPVLARFA